MEKTADPVNAEVKETAPAPQPPFIDDVAVSSQQNSTPGGSNSLYFQNNSVAGPEDVLLIFDTTSNITQQTLQILSTPYAIGNFTYSKPYYKLDHFYLIY